MASAIHSGFCLKSHDINTAALLVLQRVVHSVPQKVCLCFGPHGKSHRAEGVIDNKRKWPPSPPLSRSPSSPLGSYLKHLAADRGTSQLEAVGNATGASLGLMGLWVAPHSTQHEAVLHSWSLYIFHMLLIHCLQKNGTYIP